MLASTLLLATAALASGRMCEWSIGTCDFVYTQYEGGYQYGVTCNGYYTSLQGEGALEGPASYANGPNATCTTINGDVSIAP